MTELTSSAMQIRNMRSPYYRPEIDGLRAISILIVLAFHYWARQFPGGYIGVDVFFVISGFLITGIIHRELAAGTFSFVSFWSKRITRLYPALLLMIGVILFLGILDLTPEELKSLSLF